MTTFDEQLVAMARAARQRAYAPYSQFLVGAALRTDQGDIVCGGNVENSSYGLTVCAERAAVFTAVASGARKFECLAIASESGVTPCGACRQVLAEFCDDLRILLVDDGPIPRAVVEVSLAQLLPWRFNLAP